MVHRNLLLLVSLVSLWGPQATYGAYLFTVDNHADIIRGENGSHVLVSPTDCLSRNKDGRENIVKGVYAEIELLDGDCKDHIQLCTTLLMCIAATLYLVQQLRHLQEGLLLLKVQQIQRNEKLIFELYVS